MQTETILATLLTAAAFLKRPVQDMVTDSIRVAYDATKAHLRKRFGESSEAANALDMATAKPESLIRKALSWLRKARRPAWARMQSCMSSSTGLPRFFRPRCK